MKMNQILGIDIGGTRTKFGLVDTNTNQLTTALLLPTDYKNMDQLSAAFSKAVSEMCSGAGISPSAITAAGIGVPGFTEGDQISLVWESLNFIEGDHFRKHVETKLGLPVRVENDARTVALGELYHGSHGRVNRLLSLTLGTGVGFGLVVDGKLLEKSSINHMSGHILIRPDQEKCYCGLSGCLELLINAQRLVQNFIEFAQNQIVKKSPAVIDAKEVFDEASRDNPAAVRAINLLIEDLSAGLNVYINLFAPDKFVLGGGLSIGLQRYKDEIENKIVVSPFEGYQVEICFSKIGENAGMLGAASLWMDQY